MLVILRKGNRASYSIARGRPDLVMTHQELHTSSVTLAHISDDELLLSFRQIGQASREGIAVPLALVREIKAEVALREELRRFRLELANTVVQ